MSRLTGKTALITGAARGIGAAIASAFINEGAFVYVTDIDESTGERTARTLGSKAMFIRLDVREETDWKRCMSEISLRHERLDVLVNNAGITGLESDGAPQDPEHASLDGVAKRPPHQSRRSVLGMPGSHPGDAADARRLDHQYLLALWSGGNSWGRSLCVEQGGGAQPHQERRTLLRRAGPGDSLQLHTLWEPMLGCGTERKRNMEKFVRDTPLRRFGLPEEVAALAILLASDEATYVTGAELNIDGGLLAGSCSPPGR